MRTVFIRKVKRGKGDGLWGSYIVDRDEFGLWLYTPQGSLYRGTNGSDVSVCHAGRPEPPGASVIHLIPTTGWWFARWQGVETGAHVAIDICTPSSFAEDLWTYDDLELDLFKFRDGRFGVVDEDEFDEAIRSGHISAHEVQMSLETVAMLEARLAAGDDLFDIGGWENLEHYSQQSFEPLIDFPD